MAFFASLTTSRSPGPLPTVVTTIKLDYSDYDFEPPSLTFIDLLSGQPTMPHTRAILATEEGPRDVLINRHPLTGLPFLCFPGIREYHTHPQHSGDRWELHRQQGGGSLTTICDRVWRTMARNVLGLQAVVTVLRADAPSQLDLHVAQGDVDALEAQVSAVAAPS